jgi:4'-phosphopantetheinyl transferase EntD
MPDLLALATAAQGLFPPGVAVGRADPGDSHPVWPGEALPGALPRRLREFAAGRAAARMALARAGLPAAAIPAGDDRAPLWPAGVAGTITHSARAALAAVGRAADVGTLGLDLEEDEALAEDLWDSVLTPEEGRALRREAAPGRLARALFAAKEAAYKAQYPRTLTLFGFETLTCLWRPAPGGWEVAARFTRPVPPFAAGATLRIGVRAVQDHLVAACAIAPGALNAPG